MRMDSSELYFSDICKYKVGDKVSLVRPIKSKDRHAYNFVIYKIAKIDVGTSRSLTADNIVKEETIKVELIDDNENTIRVGIGSIRPLDKVDLSYKEHIVSGYRFHRLHILFLILVGLLLIGVAFVCSDMGYLSYIASFVVFVLELLLLKAYNDSEDEYDTYMRFESCIASTDNLILLECEDLDVYARRFSHWCKRSKSADI